MPSCRVFFKSCSANIWYLMPVIYILGCVFVWDSATICYQRMMVGNTVMLFLGIQTFKSLLHGELLLSIELELCTILWIMKMLNANEKDAACSAYTDTFFLNFTNVFFHIALWFNTFFFIGSFAVLVLLLIIGICVYFQRGGGNTESEDESDPERPLTENECKLLKTFKYGEKTVFLHKRAESKDTCTSYIRHTETVEVVVDGGAQPHHHLEEESRDVTHVQDSCSTGVKESITDDIKNNENGCVCPICLVNYELDEELLQLPVCKHLFHAECVKTWLMTNPHCPYCRANVRTNLYGFRGPLSPLPVIETRETAAPNDEDNDRTVSESGHTHSHEVSVNAQ